MGTSAAVGNLIRDSGFLYWNPSKISDLGENLGYLKDGIAFFPNIKITPIYYETTGLVPQDYIYSGCQCVVVASLLEVKTTSLQRGFFQTISSGPDFTVPGTVEPGISVLPGSTSGAMIFVPDNSPSHPCFYSSSCVSFLQDSLRIANKNLTTLSLLFYCTSFRVAPLTSLLAA